MSTICVIPARGGSTRIPRKNIRDFHGKPIIAYSIETAQKAGIFDRIIVSTDDDEIADIAMKYGAEVMMRSVALSKNEVGTQEVMSHILESLEHWRIKYACCLYPCAPLLDSLTLQRAYKMLISGCDTYYSPAYVVPVGTWLRDPGQFYFGYTDYFRHMVPLNADGTQIILIDENQDCDINTLEDWERAEKMYSELKGIK